MRSWTYAQGSGGGLAPRGERGSKRRTTSAGFEPAAGISPQRFCRPLPSTTRLQDSLNLVAGTRFERILRASETPVLPLHQPAISSERDSNPHVLADTRLSTLRVYQFRHLTLNYRPGGTRTHTLAPQRLILSQLCLHSTTSRLQPYSDSNREPEIWSHVGYQLPHRAI